MGRMSSNFGAQNRSAKAEILSTPFSLMPGVFGPAVVHPLVLRAVRAERRHAAGWNVFEQEATFVGAGSPLWRYRPGTA